MQDRIFYWIDHTGSYEGNSGVQRVVRMLARGLIQRGRDLTFVGWSARDCALVQSSEAALANLALFDGPRVSAQNQPGVPLHLNGFDEGALAGGWLLVPEVTHQTPDITQDIVAYARAHEMRIAFIFYDLIPILRDGYGDIRGLHERYAQQLALADLIIPISEYSADTLRTYYLETLRLPPAETPEIVAALLGETFTERSRPALVDPPNKGPIHIASLGTIEPRKNQIGLVKAFNTLCKRRPDLDLKLSIIGHLHPHVASEFRALVGANPRVKYLGYRSDAEAEQLYRDCHFTVFASVEEGYGLPIVESVWFGRPSVCASFGSMAEVSAGGGCLTIDTRSEAALEEALEALAAHPARREALMSEARERSFKTWVEYAAEVERRMTDHTPFRRVYLWADLIVDQPFNTGVQRVVRCLAKAIEEFGVELVGVRWDREKQALRSLNAAEAAHLAKWNGPEGRPDTRLPTNFDGEWIIIPEVMVPVVPDDGSLLPRLKAAGLRVCSIFFDLIPHKMQENYPQVALDHFTRYWLSIAQSDLLLGISKTVSEEFYDFCRPRVAKLNNLKDRIRPASLAGEFPEKARSSTPPSVSAGRLRLLNVGTIEPRKNQFRLIAAIERARAVTGVDISVTFVGRGGAFPQLDARMAKEAETHRWITRLEHVTDAVLNDLYINTDVTAFASFEEGFGLPVLESLWACRPCLCHNDGAIKEVAEGGGCLMVDMLDKDAIADALIQLASDRALIERLAEEARTRPIRTWREYALDVLKQMEATAARPAFKTQRLPGLAPAAIETLSRPILSIGVTTYNRAGWLKHSLAGILEQTSPYRDVIEVYVCDNASTDDTPQAVAALRAKHEFEYYRNEKNVGMLGNLGVTAKHAKGEYVWVMGDDDLFVPGVVENILEGILDHPQSNMVYLNYAYTHFDKPQDIENPIDVIAGATAIAEGGSNRFVERLREVAPLTENFFTAIYACIFRHRHAALAYGQNVAGPPFTSLRTCVPSTLYTMKRMLDLPAYWIGDPGVVVNMNVSWLRWALFWHLERMPELYDWAEREGMDQALIDKYRWNHCAHAGDHVRALYFNAEPEMRANFDIDKYIAQCLSLPAFRSEVQARIRTAYEEAFTHCKTRPCDPPPELLFSRFGLSAKAAGATLRAP